MSESFPLPTEPEGVIPSLVERFNSGKVEVSDIVRRGADGRWRYIIDNNQGTAVRQPA